MLPRGCLSEDLVNLIINDVKPRGQEVCDKAWWMASPNGTFTIKSAYDLLRHRRDEVD